MRRSNKETPTIFFNNLKASKRTPKKRERLLLAADFSIHSPLTLKQRSGFSDLTEFRADEIFTQCYTKNDFWRDEGSTHHRKGLEKILSIFASHRTRAKAMAFAFLLSKGNDHKSHEIIVRQEFVQSFVSTLCLRVWRHSNLMDRKEVISAFLRMKLIKYLKRNLHFTRLQKNSNSTYLDIFRSINHIPDAYSSILMKRCIRDSPNQLKALSKIIFVSQVSSIMNQKRLYYGKMFINNVSSQSQNAESLLHLEKCLKKFLTRSGFNSIKSTSLNLSPSTKKGLFQLHFLFRYKSCVYISTGFELIRSRYLAEKQNKAILAKLLKNRKKRMILTRKKAISYISNTTDTRPCSTDAWRPTVSEQDSIDQSFSSVKKMFTKPFTAERLFDFSKKARLAVVIPSFTTIPTFNLTSPNLLRRVSRGRSSSPAHRILNS